MKDIELKTCPFCGASAEIITRTEGCGGTVYPVAQVRCTECCSGTDVFFDTNNDGSFVFNAIEYWNRRILDKEKDPCSAATEQEPEYK